MGASEYITAATGFDSVTSFYTLSDTGGAFLDLVSGISYGTISGVSQAVDDNPVEGATGSLFFNRDQNDFISGLASGLTLANAKENGFTLAFWHKNFASGGLNRTANFMGSDILMVSQSQTDGRLLKVIFGDNGEYTPNFAIDDNEWHHYMLYVGETVGDCYFVIDGVKRSPRSIQNASSLAATVANGTNHRWGGDSGNFDTFYLWSMATFEGQLSRDQQISLYRAGIPSGASASSEIGQRDSNLLVHVWSFSFPENQFWSNSESIPMTRVLGADGNIQSADEFGIKLAESTNTISERLLEVHGRNYVDYSMFPQNVFTNRGEDRWLVDPWDHPDDVVGCRRPKELPRYTTKDYIPTVEQDADLIRQQVTGRDILFPHEKTHLGNVSNSAFLSVTQDGVSSAIENWIGTSLSDAGIDSQTFDGIVLVKVGGADLGVNYGPAEFDEVYLDDPTGDFVSLYESYKKIFSAYSNLFPEARFALYDAIKPTDDGTSPVSFIRNITAFSVAAQNGAFDNVDYLSPNLSIRSGPDDAIYGSDTTTAMATQGITWSKIYQRTDGSFFDLFPVLSFKVDNPASSNDGQYAHTFDTTFVSADTQFFTNTIKQILDVLDVEAVREYVFVNDEFDFELAYPFSRNFYFEDIYGRSGLYLESGITVGKNFVTDMMTAYRRELDFYGIAYPGFFHWDYEGGIDRQNALNVNTPQDGWVKYSFTNLRDDQEAAAYDTVLIDGVETLKDKFDRAFNRDNTTPVRFNFDDGSFEGSNNEWLAIQSDAIIHSFDWGLNKVFKEPTEAIFAGTSFSNYGVYLTGTSEARYLRNKVYEQSRLAPATFYMDYSSPILYPLVGSQFGNNSSAQLWAAALNVSLSGTPDLWEQDHYNLSLAWSKQIITASAGISSGVPIVPWVPMPGFTRKNVGSEYGASGDFVVTEQYLQDLCIACIYEGVRDFLFFHEDEVDESSFTESNKVLAEMRRIANGLDFDLAIQQTGVTMAFLGREYSQEISVFGASGTPDITVAGLPSGLNFAKTGFDTGLISGTPTENGTFSILIEAEDESQTDSLATNLLVASPGETEIGGSITLRSAERMPGDLGTNVRTVVVSGPPISGNGTEIHTYAIPKAGGFYQGQNVSYDASTLTTASIIGGLTGGVTTSNIQQTAAPKIRTSLSPNRWYDPSEDLSVGVEAFGYLGTTLGISGITASLQTALGTTQTTAVYGAYDFAETGPWRGYHFTIPSGYLTYGAATLSVTADSQFGSAERTESIFFASEPLELYVNGLTGSDANAGTSTAFPIRTLGKAPALIIANGSTHARVTIVRDGTYDTTENFDGTKAPGYMALAVADGIGATLISSEQFVFGGEKTWISGNIDISLGSDSVKGRISPDENLHFSQGTKLTGNGKIRTVGNRATVYARNCETFNVSGFSLVGSTSGTVDLWGITIAYAQDQALANTQTVVNSRVLDIANGNGVFVSDMLAPVDSLVSGLIVRTRTDRNTPLINASNRAYQDDLAFINTLHTQEPLESDGATSVSDSMISGNLERFAMRLCTLPNQNVKIDGVTIAGVSGLAPKYVDVSHNILHAIRANTVWNEHSFRNNHFQTISADSQIVGTTYTSGAIQSPDLIFAYGTTFAEYWGPAEDTILDDRALTEESTDALGATRLSGEIGALTEIVDLPVVLTGTIGATIALGASVSDFVSFTGNKPVTVTITGLPPQVTSEISENGVTLSGTPDRANIYNVSVSFTDVNGSTAGVTGSYEIRPTTTVSQQGSRIELEFGKNIVVSQDAKEQTTVTASGGAVTVASINQSTSKALINLSRPLSGDETVTVDIVSTSSNPALYVQSFASPWLGASNLSINPELTPSWITQTIPNAIGGEPYSTTLVAQGGNAPLVITQEGLTLGITIADNGDNTASVSGTPNEEGGSFGVTFTVTDSDGDTDTISQTFTVQTTNFPIRFLTDNVPDAIVGVTYSAFLAATGADTPIVITQQGLSLGLTLGNTINGIAEITGVPTQEGLVQFTATATDATGDIATFQDVIAVSEQDTRPLFDREQTFDGTTIGIPYLESFAFTGGSEPFTFSISGLPSGLDGSLSDNTIFVLGSPQQVGTFSVTLTVTDADQDSDSITRILEVSPVEDTPDTITTSPGAGDRDDYEPSDGINDLRTTKNPPLRSDVNASTSQQRNLFTDRSDASRRVIRRRLK